MSEIKSNDIQEKGELISEPSESCNSGSEPSIEIEGVLERVAEKDPEAALEIGEYIAVQQVLHQGPMPSPESLKQYSLVQADLPERMMNMAEISQENKSIHSGKILDLKEKELELQHKEIDTSNEAHKREIGTQKLSLLLAFVTVLVCILGAFYLAVNDKTAVAVIIGGTTVVGIVGAFLKSKTFTENKDLES